VAAYTGLRRGELQGIQWENYQDNQINATRAIWEGHISEPKTQRSKGIVPVIRTVAERLDLHRERCGNPRKGPIFANQSAGPINLNNLLNRVILPALNICIHCKEPAEKHNKATTNHEYQRDARLPQWRGWHAARRGLGTNLYALGVSDKVIQEILRHSNVSTTNSYYIKTVPQQVLDAMHQLETAIPQVLTDNEVATRKRVAAVSTAVN
jgi:integrase